MLIESAEIFLFELPFIKSYITSYGEIKKKRSILVKLSTANLSGYGECSTLPFPFYLPEYTDISFIVLRDLMIPKLVGNPINDPPEICQILSHIKGYQFAKAAVETAFWDLYSQQLKKPLWELLGGKSKSIKIGGSIGIIKDKKKTPRRSCFTH